MEEDINLFFYTNDTSKQSLRQIYPLIICMSNFNFNIFFNTNWSIKTQEKLTKYATRISLEEYVSAFSEKKTVIFVYSVFDVTKVKSIVRKKRNYKIIFRPRGIVPEESFYRRKSFFRKKILDIFEKIAIVNSDYYCFISNNQRLHYISKYYYKDDILSKSTVMHNYLPKSLIIKKGQDKIDDKYAQDRINIAYSGSFSNWQNIPEVFELVKNIYKEYEKIQFNIYTLKNNNELAFKLVKKYKLDKITSIYNLEPYELKGHIELNDVGIIIRDESIVNITASPFKVIDYLSAKVAVILTKNIGDYSMLLKDKPYAFFIESDVNGNFNYNVKEVLNFLNLVKKTSIKNIISQDIDQKFNLDEEVLNLKDFILGIFRDIE